jgi:peroxiredoxin (alkyl hydroperoxide reductase subunit C)
MSIALGTKAPDFAAAAVVGAGDETKVRLSDHKGKWVVLFFYPADFSPVCPTEIREFHRRHEEFQKLDAAVVGVSVDKVADHRKWIAEQGGGRIAFPLVSDADKSVTKSYGALIEAKGIATRATFLIGPEGNVRYIHYQEPFIARSVAEVLRTLQAFKSGAICPVEWHPGNPTLGKLG